MSVTFPKNNGTKYPKIGRIIKIKNISLVPQLLHFSAINHQCVQYFVYQTGLIGQHRMRRHIFSVLHKALHTTFEFSKLYILNYINLTYFIPSFYSFGGRWVNFFFYFIFCWNFLISVCSRQLFTIKFLF